jgi:hypothetical protein
MPPINDSPQDFWDWIKGADKYPKDLAYYAEEPRFGKSFAQKRYWQSQFDNVHKQYLGMLGRQQQGGVFPGGQRTRFEDWIKDYDFKTEYGNIPPAAREGRRESPSQFAPKTRFLYF